MLVNANMQQSLEISSHLQKKRRQNFEGSYRGQLHLLPENWVKFSTQRGDNFVPKSKQIVQMSYKPTNIEFQRKYYYLFFSSTEKYRFLKSSSFLIKTRECEGIFNSPGHGDL